MESRYLKNEKMLSRDENSSLRTKKVAVIGCGGIGGYIIEMLARLGIGNITAVDGDVFEASNLNRQLLSSPSNIGKSKALAAIQRVKMINPGINSKAIPQYITENNGIELLAGHDVIADALDSIPARKILQDIGDKLHIPIVYGAIAGWYAQLSTIYPGDRSLDKLYPEDYTKGIETELGNPSFTPALVASLQVAEIVKVLLKREGVLQNKLMTINTLSMECLIIDL